MTGDNFKSLVTNEMNGYKLKNSNRKNGEK